MMTFMVYPPTNQGFSCGHHRTIGKARAGEILTHIWPVRYHEQPMTDSVSSVKPPEDDVLLRDMLVFARRAVNAVAEKDRSDLDSDVVLAAALERFIDVVGEAASKVSVSTKEGTPDIPWPKMIDMRDRLVHGYSAVDHDIVWDVVSGDLGQMIDTLEELLAD